jgi:hypothetical protein
VIEPQSELPMTVGTRSRVPSEVPDDHQVSTRNRKEKGKAVLREKSSDSPASTMAPSRVPSEIPDGLQVSATGDNTVHGKKSDYEVERERNIARNKALLEQLGLNALLPPVCKDTTATAQPHAVKKIWNPVVDPLQISEHPTDAPLLTRCTAKPCLAKKSRNSVEDFSVTEDPLQVSEHPTDAPLPRLVNSTLPFSSLIDTCTLHYVGWSLPLLLAKASKFLPRCKPTRVVLVSKLRLSVTEHLRSPNHPQGQRITLIFAIQCSDITVNQNNS